MNDVSPSELVSFYLELHHRFHRRVDEAMSTAGLSMARAKVLKELSENGPMKQADLAASLGFAARSVTDTVDALEREALAVRRVDPLDRRARLVEMTPAGAVALARALAVKHQTMNQIFGALDAPARAEFAELLISMRDRLTSNVGAASVH